MKGLLTAILMALGCAVSPAMAQEVLDLDRLVDAVGVAENGIGWLERDVRYPYGLVSDSDWCKQERGACRSYAKTVLEVQVSRCSDSEDIIRCVGGYYCPPSVHRLNENWVRNVKHFYDKGAQ